MRDGEPGGGAQEPGGAFGFVVGVAQVGHAGAVDHDGAWADPDASVRVVLGVQGEDPGWADDDVIDVGALRTHGQGVQAHPAVVLGDVQGVVVVIAASLTVKDQPADVIVIGRRQLRRWLQSLDPQLTAESVAAVYDAARRSTTWAPTPRS